VPVVIHRNPECVTSHNGPAILRTAGAVPVLAGRPSVRTPRRVRPCRRCEPELDLPDGRPPGPIFHKAAMQIPDRNGNRLD